MQQHQVADGRGEGEFGLGEGQAAHGEPAQPDLVLEEAEAALGQRRAPAVDVAALPGGDVVGHLVAGVLVPAGGSVRAAACGRFPGAGADQPVRAPGRAVLLAEVPGVVDDGADAGPGRAVPAGPVPGGDDLLRGGDAGQGGLDLGGVVDVLGGAGGQDQPVIAAGELAVIGLHGAVAGAVHRARIRVGDVAHRLGRLLVPLPPPRAAGRVLAAGRRHGPGLSGLVGRGQPLPGMPHRRGLLWRGGPRAGHAAAGGGRDPLVVGVAPGLLRGGRLLQRDLRDRDRHLLRYPARRRLPGPDLRQVAFGLLAPRRVLRLPRGLQVRQRGRDPLRPGRPAPPGRQHRRAAQPQPRQHPLVAAPAAAGRLAVPVALALAVAVRGRGLLHHLAGQLPQPLQGPVGFLRRVRPDLGAIHRDHPQPAQPRHRAHIQHLREQVLQRPALPPGALPEPAQRQ